MKVSAEYMSVAIARFSGLSPSDATSSNAANAKMPAAAGKRAAETLRQGSPTFPLESRVRPEDGERHERHHQHHRRRPPEEPLGDRQGGAGDEAVRERDHGMVTT